LKLLLSIISIADLSVIENADDKQIIIINILFIAFLDITHASSAAC